MKCRYCNTSLHDVFLDLGSAPPSNALLNATDLDAPELHFPLRLYTCSNCHLVQVDEVQRHDALFSSDYAYFSSYSRTWLTHAERYVAYAIGRLGLGSHNFVMEIASNDGYLLQYVKACGIPCIGIEPTASTAAAARARGIETIELFFSERFASEFAVTRQKADLIIANNVLAHVPDLNDFVAGLSAALAPDGTITVEFPHLLQLLEHCQFDTIYHEHFSYFSFHTVRQIFVSHGLRIWDVEELPTHGGSLRLWACHLNATQDETSAVDALLARESAAGMMDIGHYLGFQPLADGIKNAFLAFLLECKRDGKRVVGYGAAAKGNTLLNYAGVRPDLLNYVVDASPHKQGRYLPGSRIPVVDEKHIREDRPDYVVILPWNLREEITTQLNYIREWGGKFVTAVPALRVE
ncbi:class I SAM-dependent methyltransferase [Rhodanobacter sp. 7MK24]|uniref:class I SAM-dependent methyltransferase n=1 Tax=Rhodanobacter sp. 7MK24 TaxID=2775922 RepID=UPI001780145C|nr:class I SAM-dependent methyltransferase [Rhodanobacter sp. 7MK24]MBD8880537.1 class I SAM-dependent methyltransferase [Rhodanobacter sp. 7MK24]